MKITFVINAMTAGGAERAQSILANYWAGKDHQVSLLTFDDGSVRPFYPLHSNIIHKTLAIATKNLSSTKKLLALPKLLKKLRTAIKETSPDIVISYMDQANMLCLAALRGTQVPTIVCEQVHPALSPICDKTTPLYLRYILQHLRNYLYTKASRIVLLCMESTNYFPKNLHRKIVIIPNPIITPLKEVADIEIRDNTILTIGRLTPQKNHKLLIDAFGKIAAKYPAWHLCIIGEGPLRKDLEKQVEDLNLTDRVNLAGISKTPYALLNKAAFFVLSSDYEGFPLTLGEAMASAKAVIATDCPTGPAELIQDGLNGLLVPLKDAEALSLAIEKLISDQKLRNELAAKASLVTKQYNVENIAAKWETILPN